MTSKNTALVTAWSRLCAPGWHRPEMTPAPVGLRLIVAYKLAKAALEIAFGALLVLFATKATNELRTVAIHVRDHGTAAWSISLAEKVVQEATPRHLIVAAVASLLDGVLTSIEGWALH